MSTTTATKFDPVTFEVLRHKLDEIVAEAYHTMGRVSGSPVVYEAGDHQEALLTATGELASFGGGALSWVRSISMGVRHVASTYAENPGIFDGDQFLVNDTYHAAVHAGDVQVLAPIMYEGRLIAWAGSASHQVDTGGMTPGGAHVNATDVYAEGFQTRGLKIVERGVIRRDVEDTFANMVRVSALGLLDIRAKMASNNVMRERLLEMVERYGVDTLVGLFDQLIEYSEMRLRRRLAAIPDGEWYGSDVVEALVGGSFSVRVKLTKRDDSLTFDFTGTSPQTAGAENVAIPGTESGALNPIIMMLGHDLPWNEGLFRPVDFVIPEGTVINPIRPAPISANVPCGASLLVMASCQSAVSKMLLASEAFRDEAAANAGASFICPILAGPTADGGEFATVVLECMAGGGGAHADKDGESSGFNQWAVKNSISNVETYELSYPIMYLWRREVTDSGGAGKYRGGVGLNAAIMPWQSPGMAAVTIGAGNKARTSLGVAGGYPAATVPVGVAVGADLDASLFADDRVASTVADLPGEHVVIPGKGLTMLGPNDVFYADVSGGGGGYGDPMHRDPQAVRDDVRLRRVSVEMAEAVYGVVLDAASEVDDEATAVRRREIAADRLEKARKHATTA